jgi:hypothetical protein
MGRLKKAGDERPTTTARLYEDTVRVLKLLAEAQGLTMIDYIDRLAREAAQRDAKHVLAVIESFRSRAAGEPE